MSNIGNSRQFVITVPGAAANISFDGTQCVPPLTATNVQDAICEVNSGGGGGGTLEDAYNAGTGTIPITTANGPLYANGDGTTIGDTVFLVTNEIDRDVIRVTNDTTLTSNITMLQRSAGQTILGNGNFIVGDVAMLGFTNTNNISMGGIVNTFGVSGNTRDNVLIGGSNTISSGDRNQFIGIGNSAQSSESNRVLGENVALLSSDNVNVIGSSILIDTASESTYIVADDGAGSSYPKFGDPTATETNTFVRKGFNCYADHTGIGYIGLSSGASSVCKTTYVNDAQAPDSFFSDPFEFDIPTNVLTTLTLKAWVSATNQVSGEVSTILYTWSCTFENNAGVVSLVSPAGGFGFYTPGGLGNPNGSRVNIITGTSGAPPGQSNIPSGATGFGMDVSSNGTRGVLQLRTNGTNFSDINTRIFSKLRYFIVSTQP